MNHIYQVIFNRSLGVSQVVSENTRACSCSSVGSIQPIQDVTSFKKSIYIVSILGLMGGIASGACTSGVDTSGATTFTCIEETQWGGISPTYDHVIIKTTLAGGFTPIQGHGLYANNSTWNLRQLTVETSGSAADAIRTNGNGVINIGDNLYVKTTGSSADAINSTEDSNGRITIGNNMQISTASGIGVRANISKNAAWSNNIVIGNNATIKTTGSGSNFLDSTGYAVYAGIRSWVASSALGNASVVMGDDSQITTEGGNAYAVYANYGGTIQLGSTTIKTTGSSASAVIANDSRAAIESVVRLNGNLNQIETQGNNASGLVASNGRISVNGLETFVKTAGSNAYGALIETATGALDINGHLDITTTGTNAHGLRVASGATKTLDNTANNMLPTITVQGAGSAALNVTGNNSKLTISGNSALNMTMTAGVNTWGVKAETSGVVAFAGTSDTGGTGLWASNGTIQFNETSNAAGSHVKLDNTSTFNLSTHNGALSIGSLEGSTASMVNLGNNTLNIGDNNTNADGSLMAIATYAGHFSNTGGSLYKTGTSTQVLSGLANTVANVIVNAGTLDFEQNGLFSVTGNYTTQGGATTKVGLNNGVLDIGGIFTQAANSSLDFTLGASPDIRADSAQLDGDFIFNGFTAGVTPMKASDALAAGQYVVIRTVNGISGNFRNIIDAAGMFTPTGVEYLLLDGHVSSDMKDYELGFRLAWDQGGANFSTGDFTLNSGTAFNIDHALEDKNAPVGGFVTGWNGRDLKKLGTGELVLSVVNTYTGSTTIGAGKLTLRGKGDIASSDAVALNGTSAILDISSIDAASTTINNLSGVAGSQIILQGKTVQVNQNNNGVYAGDFDASNASLHKTGAAELTLSGKTLYTGDTLLDAGQLTLDGSAGGAILNSNVIAQAGTTLNLKNGAVLTGFIDPTDVNIDALSRWNMTADSIVNTLNHTGTINMTVPTNDTFKNLIIEGNYIGNNGLLIMNTQLGNDTSLTDHIVVEGNTAGSTRVQINNAGGTGAKTLEGIELIEVKGISAGEFKQTGRIVAGAYDYTLVRGAGNLASNWYLTSELSHVDPINPPIFPIFPSSEKQSALRPEGASYLANLAAVNSLFGMNLADRIGAQELMQNEGDHGQTLWMRGVGGESRFRDQTGQLDSKSTYYSLQLGSDLANWTTHQTGEMTVGVMAGYGKNDSKETSKATGYRSEGSVSGYSVGIYGTWYANALEQTGAYVDSWAQYNWFNNRVKGDQIHQESYGAQGISASLEAGYRFKVARGERLNYFIQPHAQVIWHGVSADDHRENNGTRIYNQTGNVLETRAGLKMSAQTRTDLANRTRPTLNMFVETNWIHRSQDLELRMDDVSVKQAGMGNVGEMKVGIESKLNQQLHVWGNLSHQRGSKGFKNTAVNLGLVYQF